MTRKILSSLMVIALAAMMVGLGTFAYYSDTEASTGNTFTAGTLDLRYAVSTDGGTNWSAWQNGTDFSIVLGNLAPGNSGTIIYRLSNVGSLAGYLDFENVTIVNTEGLNPESETDITEPGDLGANSIVSVTLGGTPVYTGTVNGLATWDASYLIPASGGFVDYVLAWNIPTTVENDIQGDIVAIGVTFELAQTITQ